MTILTYNRRAREASDFHDRTQGASLTMMPLCKHIWHKHSSAQACLLNYTTLLSSMFGMDARSVAVLQYLQGKVLQTQLHSDFGGDHAVQLQYSLYTPNDCICINCKPKTTVCNIVHVTCTSTQADVHKYINFRLLRQHAILHMRCKECQTVVLTSSNAQAPVVQEETIPLLT